MPKVLTLHNTGNISEHWFQSSEYKNREIDAIDALDPRAGRTYNPPTSVPSPFAQMDLVLTAFKNASKDKNLTSLTQIDFKLISDALDIGEVFFNYNRLKKQPDIDLDIIVWEKKENLTQIKDSINPKHQRLGNALELYLNQDAQTYNFSEMSNIYILRYNHKVIGATSPATLFFASTNDLSFVDITMSNGDKLFDNECLHLHKRDADFQRWFYGLMAAMPDFRNKFKAVSEYMDICRNLLQHHNRDLHRELTNITGNFYTLDTDIFDNLTLGQDEQRALILGRIPFLCLKDEGTPNPDKMKSDFRIKSNKCGDLKPLVLKPNHDGRSRSGEALIYYTHPYDPSVISVPYEDKRPVAERFLPGLAGVQYPYITVDDFLEPYLVRLPYPINNKQFFDGNLQNRKEEKDYLLPIKPLFFDYFDVQDIASIITMEAKSNGTLTNVVVVKLKIPIQNNNFVTYERTYYTPVNPMDIPTPSATKNEGYIVEHEVGLTIYPFLRTPDTIAADYRIMLVDRDIKPHTKDRNYHLDFYANNSNVSKDIKAKQRRIDKKAHNRATSTTEFYVVKDNFDYIRLHSGLAYGIVIPLFETKQSGSEKYHFAIDFGTTNTHIEYRSDKFEPKAFDITENDLQIGTLHDTRFLERNPSVNGTAATKIFTNLNALLPQQIGTDKIFRFPQRTVILERKGIQETDVNTTHVLSDFNIPFSFGKKNIEESDFNMNITSNLKWAKLKGIEDKRVEMFFEQLLFMIRTKVLLNDGDLNATKLTVFYPTSMEAFRKRAFEKKWKEKFRQYITNQTEPLLLHEGLAPFFYFTKVERVSASSKPAVSIDIGGGTTDVVIFRQEDPSRQINTPISHTSFRFAANAIFGNGLMDRDVRGVDSNGFVQRYKKDIENLVKGKGMLDLEHVLQQILTERDSDDIINFFFSLSDNPDFASKINKSFNDILLDDDDMRITFVVFYAAIIYHIAKLMKAQRFDTPTYLTFSGNGSKVLDLLAHDGKTLEALAKAIFQKVYGLEQYDKDGLSIKRVKDFPKAITCKGGLMLSAQEENVIRNVDADDMKAVLLGKKDTSPTNTNLSTAANPIFYDNLKEADYEAIVEEVEGFFDFLFDDLNKSFSFSKQLGIPPKELEGYRDVLKQHTRISLNRGIAMKHEQFDADTDSKEPIEETLFFYPIIAAINRLAIQIHLKNN